MLWVVEKSAAQVRLSVIEALDDVTLPKTWPRSPVVVVSPVVFDTVNWARAGVKPLNHKRAKRVRATFLKQAVKEVMNSLAILEMLERGGLVKNL